MKLELIPYTDLILHEKTQPFDFENPPHDPAELAEAMNALVEEKNGLGLACPQVGISFAMFVMRGPIACFNPTIITVSDELIELEEGCLSLAGIVLKINRPRHVRVRYQDQVGKTHTATWANMTARIVQHEMDHLEGILFTDLVSRTRLDMAIRKAKKLKYNYSIGELRKNARMEENTKV